jgi:hypothetical protein
MKHAVLMGRKKTPGGEINKRKPTQLRLHNLLREQLEKLVDRNVSDLSTEIATAIRERLEKFDLWPPKPDE